MIFEPAHTFLGTELYSFPLSSSLLFRSDLSPSDVAIIREVYDNDNSEDIFQMELEKALQVL